NVSGSHRVVANEEVTLFIVMELADTSMLEEVAGFFDTDLLLPPLKRVLEQKEHELRCKEEARKRRKYDFLDEQYHLRKEEKKQQEQEEGKGESSDTSLVGYSLSSLDWSEGEGRLLMLESKMKLARSQYGVKGVLANQIDSIITF